MCVCVCVYTHIYIYIYIYIYKDRERKLPLIRLARDQTGAQLLNIPGLSDGTNTQLNFLRVIICYCPYLWAVQRNRGILHFVISFISYQSHRGSLLYFLELME